MADPAHNEPRSKVAIIGTGLAGLTTAYLVHNDDQKRYRVTLFDQAERLSFDGQSVAVKNDETDAVERVDLPMRASAGGYYANLMQMYKHLGVPLHPVRFWFVFAESLSRSQRSPMSTANGASDGKGSGLHSPGAGADIAGGAQRRYFTKAPTLYQTLLLWPANMDVISHLVQFMYLILCHLWLSVACVVVPPVTTSAKGLSSDGGETFAEYLERIWLPRRYTSQYLLPVMCSISTCTHDEILAFPASDIVHYRRMLHGQRALTVCGGVSQIQSRLSEGVEDVRLGARVVGVTPNTARGGASIRWQSKKGGLDEVLEEHFDRVVLAVSPDVAGKIFKPLEAIRDEIPTVQVESSVLVPTTSKDAHSVVDRHEDASSGCMHHEGDRIAAQTITFNTTFSGKGSRTEALHTMPSGVVVSSCPLDSESHAKSTLQHAKFTRTLRTPNSRAAVQRIMGLAEPDEKNEEEWVNGDNDVWIAGAWCWDGMVLLEGCIVSAMQVADDLGVRIPWRPNGVVRT